MTAPPPTGADELVDVLDDAGRPVRVAPRSEVRRDNLWHRSVFVAVVAGSAPDEQVVVHQRAAWKDVWPSRWDVAFGGVVGAGEDWEAAATRELAEEAGIAGVALEPVGDGRFADEHVREVARVFLARHDGPITCPDGEVAAVGRVHLATLDAWVAGHDLVPDSAALVVPLLAGRSGRRLDEAATREVDA